MLTAARATQHVVMFSSGVGSWMAAKRVAAQRGTADLTLLFTDTLIEDEDTYRFLHEAAANVGGTFVRVADGRTPWQLFHDVRFIGNSRIAPCSHILKQEQARKWVDANCGPDTVIYLGIDWMEQHRLAGARKGWTPYRVEAPLCEKPYLTKQMMHDAATAAGLRQQRLYVDGASHANCGSFCVRAGHQAFAHLLATYPERYAYHEAEEEKMRAYLDADVSIMKDEAGGSSKPLTMRTFRTRVQGGAQIALDGFGGCGCFLDEADEEGNQ
jgi:hypothetical protein